MSEEILINGKKITELSDMFFEYCELKKENEELRQVRKNSPDIQEPYIYLYRQIKEQYHKLEEENESLKSLNDFNVQKIEVLQKENEELKTYIQKMDKPEIKTIDSEIALKNIELQKENEESKKELERLYKECYETFKMLKHEYDGRRKDNEQWFTRCTENHNEDSKVIEKYRSALEEIRARIKQYHLKVGGEVVGSDTIFDIEKKINEMLNDRD